MSCDIPNEMHAKIQQLCKQGDDLVRQEMFDDAIQLYEEALDLLPEPVQQWEAATWIFTAIGDASFLKKHYHKALQSLLERVLKMADDLL